MSLDSAAPKIVLTRRINKSKFSRVYEAEINGKTCVVKRTKTVSNALQRFYNNEKWALCTLGYLPGVLPLLNAFRVGKYSYIVVEMASHDLFDEATTCTERRARVFARQILETLAEIHDKEVAHCDLKAENVLVMPDGRAVLADWQFAQWGSYATNCKVVHGTREYIAPEICSGDYDARVSDIWAFGVLMHGLLMNDYPYTWPQITKMMRTGTWIPPKPMSGVSDECVNFIQHALTLEPEMRATAAELLQHKWLRGDNLSLPDASD